MGPVQILSGAGPQAGITVTVLQFAKAPAGGDVTSGRGDMHADSSERLHSCRLPKRPDPRCRLVAGTPRVTRSTLTTRVPACTHTTRVAATQAATAFEQWFYSRTPPPGPLTHAQPSLLSTNTLTHNQTKAMAVVALPLQQPPRLPPYGMPSIRTSIPAGGAPVAYTITNLYILAAADGGRHHR